MKKLTIAVLIGIMVLVLVGPAIAKDITAEKLLDSLAKNDSNYLTRADFVTMLVKAAVLEPEQTSVQLPSDLSPDAWYAEPMKVTLQKGIIHGYSDGTIRPEQEITLLEASALVVRTLGLPDNVPAPGITDLVLASEHWGYNILSWVVIDEFITNDTVPTDKLTREAGANLLEKVFGTNEKARNYNKRAEKAQKAVKTMRIDGTMNFQMKFNSDMAGQENMPAEIETTAKMTGELVMKQGMHQTVEVNLSIPGTPLGLTMEQYLTDEGMFMKMSNPQTGEAMWNKMPKDMFPKMSDLLKQQSNPIPAEVDKMFYYRYLGEENGATKLAFYGKIDDFNKFMSMVAGQGLPAQEMQEMTEQVQGIIKSTAIKGTMLINNKTNLPISSNMFAAVVFNKEFAGEGFPVESMITEYYCNYKDYNKNISIVLPKEALQAEEIPMTPQPVEKDSEAE